MTIRSSLLIGFALFATSATAVAGEFNEVLNIGDAAPSWSNLPGTDGKSHSLADYKEKAAVVLIFTCASCPTAVDYEDRLNELAKRFGGANGQVAFVAVCVNRVKGDLLIDLTERAKQRQFAFDYVPTMDDFEREYAYDEADGASVKAANANGWHSARARGLIYPLRTPSTRWGSCGWP